MPKRTEQRDREEATATALHRRQKWRAEGATLDQIDVRGVVDLAARRSQRTGQQIAEQYSTAQIILAIRKLKISAHSNEKLVACYGGEHRCGACHEPWAAHTPGEVRAHVELIAQLATQPQPPAGA